MPDVYATITETDPKIVEQIANAMEIRATNPQQREFLDTYLSQIEFPTVARILEVGCGTGPVCRRVAELPNAKQVVGLDPSPILLKVARELSKDLSNLTFEEGDGRTMPFDDESFDIVIFHTVLCHIPHPEKALVEAYRVLRSGGYLAVFDGDYATITVATGKSDPLQQCVEAFAPNFIHDIWFVRRLQNLVQEIGFSPKHFQSFGYVETSELGHLLTIVDRGSDVLVAQGRIGQDMGAAMKAEARRRAAANEFFGFVGYASLVCQK